MTRPQTKLLALPISPNQPPAPRARRLLAFGMDLLLTAVLSVATISLLQFAWPSNSPAWLIVDVTAGLVLGFTYLGFAPLSLGNTLGKWIFSLQLSSRLEAPVTAARLLKRLLTLGVWPINALMVLSGRSRAHLGDRWAGTTVVLAPRGHGFGSALAIAAVVAVGAVKLGSASALLGIVRSEAWQAAKTELAAEPGATAPTFPSSFSMLGNLASFDADVGKGLRRIVIARSRDGSHWNLVSNLPVEPH